MRREKFENISFAPTELGIIGVEDGPADEDLGELIANSKILGTKIKMWRPPRGAGNHVPGLLSLSGDSGWGHLYAISQETISMLVDIVYAMQTDKERLLSSLDQIRKIVSAS